MTLRSFLRREQGGDNGIILMAPRCITKGEERGQTCWMSSAKKRFDLLDVIPCHFLVLFILTHNYAAIQHSKTQKKPMGVYETG